jgi:thiol-disulfide isomerase/thioredoxin
MSKPLLAGIAFVGIMVISVGFLFVNKSESPSPSTNSSQSLQTENPSAARQGTGQYVDYTEDTLANATGQRVLFFHAPWCPQCRAIESDINSQGVPDGYTILKVDYDSSQELRQKYGVTLQTTFVKVDENGNATADKFVAYSEPSLEALTRDYLN